jgi:hypothetical protein
MGVFTREYVVKKSRVAEFKLLYVLTIALGTLLTHYAYFPGLMVNDSSTQFEQALTFHFTDWHPPLMAFIWSLTNRVIPGPEGFFLLELALYWIAFLMIGLRLISEWAAAGHIGYRYIALLLLPFAPFLLNILGDIWKDVFVFGCFGVALGLILLRPRNSRLWSWHSLLVLSLLIVGSLARWNSIVAAVPLLVLHLWPTAPNRWPIRMLLLRGVVATGLTIAGVSAAGYSLDAFVLHAQKTHIVNSIFLFDLVGISHHIDRNLVPGDWTPAEATEIRTTCYTPMYWSPLSFYGRCQFVYYRLAKSGQWQNGLFPVWFRAVIKYPAAYVAHRLDYLHTLLWPQTTFTLEPNKESFQFGFKENLAFRTIRAVMVFTLDHFPFYFIVTDGFWMVISTMLAIAVLWYYAKLPDQYYTALLVAVSGVFNALPLVIVGQAGDYRYVYWTAGVTCVAALLIPSRPKRAATKAAGAAGLVDG